MDFAAYEARLDARESALASLCVHAGEEPNEWRALATPIVLASAFSFDDAEHAAAAFRGDNDAFIYGRWGNPTVESLEAKLAALEKAEAACATASGMAAISGTIVSLCESGSHIVAPRSMYGESARLLRERLPRLGIETTFVDDPTPEAYAAASAGKNTRVFYIESPSNPTLAVADIPGMVREARARKIVTIADNTFATPFCQTPLDLGVDLVVHSMTKAIGGHGDAIGGVVCGSEELVGLARDTIVKGFGGVMSPLVAYLVSRGVVTFALRQRRACSTAARLARVLAEHPKIERVHHPSLQPERAAHMHAYGSILSFELMGPNALEAGRAVLEGVELITHAVSLGDARSLVTHPATTTHASMPAEQRKLANVTDGLLRLSVGLESASDLERDLLAAL